MSAICCRSMSSWLMVSSLSLFRCSGGEKFLAHRPVHLCGLRVESRRVGNRETVHCVRINLHGEIGACSVEIGDQPRGLSTAKIRIYRCDRGVGASFAA